MLVIRLKRVGKKKQPEYRMVVAPKTAAVNGGYIERVGYFHPKTKELKLNKEKIEAWLKKGARPSNSVAKLLQAEKIDLPKWASIKVFPARPSKAEIAKASGKAPAEAAVTAPAAEGTAAEEVAEAPKEASAETPAPETAEVEAPVEEKPAEESKAEESKKEEK